MLTANRRWLYIMLKRNLDAFVRKHLCKTPRDCFLVALVMMMMMCWYMHLSVYVCNHSRAVVKVRPIYLMNATQLCITNNVRTRKVTPVWI